MVHIPDDTSQQYTGSYFLNGENMSVLPPGSEKF